MPTFGPKSGIFQKLAPQVFFYYNLSPTMIHRGDFQLEINLTKQSGAARALPLLEALLYTTTEK